MSTDKTKDFLYKLLTDPHFRIWRHTLLIVTFTFVAIGQSLIVFGEHISDISNNTLYWFGALNVIGLGGLVYFNLIVLTRRTLLKRKYAEYLLCLFAAISLYLFIKGAIELQILNDIGVDRKFNGVMLLDGLSNLMIYAICIAGGSISVLFGQWTSDTERITNLQNRQLKSSVEKLKNRINPKFLSNTLDYVIAKIKTNAEEVPDILLRLSKILRYGLYDCMREKVLLKSDIEHINSYLSLNQLSSKNKYTYSIIITGDTGIFIAPFLFMPIVQRILEQQPTDVLLKFDITDTNIAFECKVQGTDLADCELSEEERRLEMFYEKESIREKGFVKYSLERC
ncbi:histidine kinase [Dysgonomonas sp. 521]|uniref:histidine kinase n=1 Tax=unclassified Dysgonomonas TaxID=2630389 RepID=UPI0013D00332|nr:MULTISPECIES: histidine kinase [unclassified Dysgonomonas]NDV96908.1 histidine kinase [Dysgonomonas sp. 521]NDW08287.1 histidine kinase [Dysgonomonas sp. 520]